MANNRPPPARLGVFVSGGGRTMANLVDCARSGTLDAEVAVVIASKGVPAIERARALGVPTEIHPGTLTGEAIDAIAERHGLDWIVLAGYLRRVPITPRVADRVVNIHPGLLPGDGTAGRFGGAGMHGAAVHRAVIAAFDRGEVTESGCTVHLCDDAYDTGPVVLTRRCPVLPGDTPEALAARVFELELEAYPAALQRLIERDRTTGP